MGVDVERSHQRDQRGVVDEADRHRAAGGFAADRGEHVDLVVIGHRQHRVGTGDARLLQELHVHRVAVQHDGAFERVGGVFGDGAVELDDLGAHPVGAALERFGDREADIAAAEDHHPFLAFHFLAEDLERALRIGAVGHHVDLVAGEDLVVALGHEQRAVAAHADDDGLERREQIAELPERRVDDRAVFLDLDAEQRRLSAEEQLGVEGGGGGEPAQHGERDFALGADDHVDRQVLAAVEVGIDRVEVGLRPEAGDLARDVEDRMGHLAGDHVDLVGIGRGDDHVGVPGPCPLQHIRVGGKAGHPLHIQRLHGARDQVRVVVDHRHVVLLAGKMARDLPADLARAADDDLHAGLRSVPGKDWQRQGERSTWAGPARDAAATEPWAGG